MRMLSLLAVVLAMTTGQLLADIQDPPANDFGPTRKLSRGFGNLTLSLTEIPDSIAKIDMREGDPAAASYGVIKGFGRFFFRIGAGLYEMTTFPFPLYKASYRPFYNSTIPWIHGGYEEFPPELGFKSRYRYVRSETGY